MAFLWVCFDVCLEASGSQTFLFSCVFHSADTIMIARALGGAFYTQFPRLTNHTCVQGVKTFPLFFVYSMENANKAIPDKQVPLLRARGR